MNKMVVVLSGGMDSAVLLYDCLKAGHEVAALSVHYGQRHSTELISAQWLVNAVARHPRYAKQLLAYHVVDLHGLRSVMKGSSQTDAGVAVPHGRYDDDVMKKTVVPNRNMLLLSVAGALAVSVGAEAIAYGAHAGDHAIYPDCRPAFVAAMDTALGLCDYVPLRMHVPFLDMSKGDIAKLGLALGVPFELTWTCYEGDREHGPCGKCGACVERAEAFSFADATDPLVHAHAERVERVGAPVDLGGEA